MAPRAMRETVGWAVGPPGRRPAAASGQGSVEGAPGPKNHPKPYVFVRFLKHPCDSHTVLKLKIRNFERGLKFEPKRRRPVGPVP